MSAKWKEQSNAGNTTLLRYATRHLPIHSVESLDLIKTGLRIEHAKLIGSTGDCYSVLANFSQMHDKLLQHLPFLRIVTLFFDVASPRMARDELRAHASIAKSDVYELVVFIHAYSVELIL